ncbi:hypothetical protein HNI00_18595 [Thermoleptolyngbya oregonensis NK1-22]|uniref:Uncharacterized protein n=1 Tax=Thermoleptolyngbya oregonensis NK1-22 TaxID=2547457 RepID=A0AA96YC25_9CYAN|nr:hypothetical protein [Thermoleptolyngbya oregonensis]WOB44933.1 hypothetical protein HNI00_18595 [Thermoleptolyngbya oregonensis NK1-22]
MSSFATVGDFHNQAFNQKDTKTALRSGSQKNGFKEYLKEILAALCKYSQFSLNPAIAG